MNFFQELDKVLSPGLDYNLTISKRTDGGMTVIYVPTANGLQDGAKNQIVPLNFSGNAQAIDAQFIPTISNPSVQQVSELLLNMKQFEEGAKKAASQSKAAKQVKEAETKEAKDKREKYEDFMKKAEEQEKAGNIEGAMTNLNQARLHATEKNAKTIDEKVAKLQSSLTQGSLFDVGTVQAQPTQQTPPSENIQQQQATPESAQPIQQTHPAMQVQQTGSQVTQLQEAPVVQSQAEQQPQQRVFFVQTPPAAQPIQQTASQQPAQPAQQQTGFNMFTHQPQQTPKNQHQETPMEQPARPQIQQPQPMATQVFTQTAYVPVYGEPVHRPSEYDEYPDFPPELQAQVYSPAPNQ